MALLDTLSMPPGYNRSVSMGLASGDKLGPYEILAPIGAGGMGEVYRARDTRLHREVAVKVLPQSFANEASRERFQREARAASALNHPRICAVYDVGEAEGYPYIVMELLDGQTLRDYVDKRPLEPAVVIMLGAQIADALAAAHAKGIIHRDIKAGNIMVIGQRDVKVLDFGLAKHIVTEADETRSLESMTAMGVVMGTPHYMAPELLQGNTADGRSDLWSLGVVLFEMLTGRLPFQGRTALAVSSAILSETVPRLPATVPSQLRTIVERCLSKRPGERYQDAGEVRLALERLQADAAHVPSRKRWFFAAGIVAILVSTAFLWQRSHPPVTRRLTSSGAPLSLNQEANDAFELAMSLQRIQNDIPRAQQVLEHAIALDPHFAEALRYHAFNYTILILNGYSNDTSLLYKAEDELRQAEGQDPRLAGLASSRAAVYLMQGRKELVPVRELDQILQSDPFNHEVVLWRGLLLWLSGSNTEFKKRMRDILERDPLFAAARMFLGETLRTEGDLEGAIKEQRKVLEQAPGNISSIRLLALSYMDAGEMIKARALLEEKRLAFGKNYSWRLAWAVLLAREGRPVEARQAIDEETLKFAGAAFSATLDAAEYYAVQGDTAKAIEWLERAVRNGDQRVEWFKRNPAFATIRGDSRFRQILDSVQLERKQAQAH